MRRRACSESKTGARGVTRECEAEDGEYLREMREILEAYPLMGPPEHAVRLAPHLYIGNQKNADDIAALKRLDITFVLNCAGSRRLDFKKPPYPRCARIEAYLAIPAEDRIEYDIMQHFVEAFAFIDKAKRRGTNVLVHCNLGINRSGAVCAAYLMANQHMYLLEVIKLLKARRSVVLWNKGFRLQLIKFARNRGYLDPRQQSVPDSGMFTKNASSPVLNSLDRRHYGGKTPPCERAKRAAERKDAKEEKQSNGSLLAASLRRSFKSRLATSILAKHSSFPSFGSDRGNSEPETSRFSMAYLTVPRHSRSPKEGKGSTLKRPVLSSHYESDYFADSMYGSHGRGAPAFRQTRSSNDNFEVSSTCHEMSSTRHSRRDIPDGSANGDDSSTLSTTRPLRVYRKAATDTQIYVKPTTNYHYRRSETVATDMTHEFSRMQLGEGRRDQPRKDHSYAVDMAPKDGRLESPNVLSSRHRFDMTSATN